MQRTDAFTRVLAVIGTVLVWLPIIAPLVLAVTFAVTQGRWLLDYLMPAELGVLVLLGSGLLIIAAVRAHQSAKPLVLALVAAVGLLVGSQAVAVVTGLADGRIAPAGWQWALVLTLYAGYALMVILIDVLGVRLTRRVLQPS